MIAGVIFDLYGTLLRLPRDSQPYYKMACRHPPGHIGPSLKSALTHQFPTLGDYAASIGLPPQDDIATLVTLKELGVLVGAISIWQHRTSDRLSCIGLMTLWM